MTPHELLDEVKSRFTPLLVREKNTLESMLRQALSAYQDRAGYIRRVRIEKEAGVALPYPEDYLSLVGVADKRGALVYSDDFGTAIELDLLGSEHYPFTLTYLVNLSDRPFDKWVVPATIRALIMDYLEILIAINNTERKRRMSIAGKVDASAFPDDSTLYQRKIDLEANMSAHRAMVFSGSLITGANGHF
ncbi:hypothetical protein O3W44_22255 [Pantoea sp. LMR881]|uniref:hypothetical protein n=1 Tax=Pantoea sp. LMR881 TaxID=3014336 RepID=UPI0022AF16A9|nr:hypothetical protein [Pantoea sp. LMR881]MCZ4061256.1 hypothetical protein [Pantoea sp. LMR881]